MGSQPQMSRGWPRTFLPRFLMGSTVGMGTPVLLQYPTFALGMVCWPTKMFAHLRASSDGPIADSDNGRFCRFRRGNQWWVFLCGPRCERSFFRGTRRSSHLQEALFVEPS